MSCGEQVGAVVLAAVVVLSMSAPVVAGGPATDDRAGTALQWPGEHAAADAGHVSARSDATDPPPDGSSAGNGPGEPPGANVSKHLRNASGTVQVVVRLDPANLSVVRGEGPPGQASERARQRLKEVAERTQRPVVRRARSSEGMTVLKRFWITNAVLVRVDLDRVDLDELAGIETVQRLHRNFEVQIPNGTNGTATGGAETTATDGATATGTTSNGYNTTYGVDRVNATDVWEAYDTRGGGVKVAVLDTGINVDHPDLELYTENASDPTYPGGWAEFDSEGDRVKGSTPYDSGTFFGHGSHVSGTIAGGNASGEYIGVAPNVSLMHALVLKGGSGSFAQIIAGMQWAVENDADVISMSLGAAGYYPSFVEPIRNAEAAGAVVVAAEGNDDDTTSSPGAVYDAISVGASDEADGLPYFSGGVRVNTSEAWYPFAPDEWPAEYVVPDLVAPGDDVKSATSSVFSRQYYEASGSSMATPHVAGVVALALAAAENASVEQTKDAVISSGWKPADCDEEFGEFGLDGECRPNGTDIGYGYGIVDAKTAVDRLAADSGFEGTVTDPSGDPVEGATVELDNFDVETDADGQYTLRESAGTYTVTADGFGYEPETKTATVTEGNFTRLDFALNETLAVELVSPQRDALRPGNSTTVTVRAAHVESWTVTRAGDFEGDATLYVNGREVAFGETVAFDDYTGTVNVTVHVADGGGNLTLEHAVTGAGESTTVTTGPTLVTDEIYRVAVVGAYRSGYAPSVQLMLDRTLPRNYRLSFVLAEDALEVTERYDVFVVQNLGADPSPEFVRQFKRATDDPGTGVVFLDQRRSVLFTSGRTSDAISQLSRATNDPKRTAGQDTFAADELDYRIRRDHPILAGVGEPGENVTIQARDAGIEYTYFEEFSGQTLASVSLPEGAFSTSPGPKGPGLAIDETTRTVLAASLGRYREARNDQFTDAADRILANAVTYLSRPPQATVADRQPAQVDRGEAATATFAVEDLQAVTVSVADRSTLSAEDLALTVDGERAAFGERLSFDNRTSDAFTVTVVSDDANGTVALETTFESAGADVPLTLLTGPTAVYDPPLVVGRDVGSLETAMEMVQPGGTVHVADGTYVEQVVVDKPGVTVTALPGASPVVSAPADMERYSSVLRVEEPGTTVEGLHLAVNTSSLTDNSQAVEDYYGIEFRYSPHDSTVRNVSIDGAGTGIAIGNPARDGGFEPNVTDSTISGVVINDTTTGIQVGIGSYLERTSGLRVVDTRITNVEPASFFGDGYGIFHEFGVNVTYANVTVEDCRTTGFFSGCTGFATDLAWGVTFENGTVRSAKTGVYFGSSARQLVVRNNTIADTETGVFVQGYEFQTGRVTGNDIDAETGIEFRTKEAPTVAVHYNDLSDSEVPVTKSGAFGFFPPPEYDPDVRLNYFGQRGPTAEDTREGRYDPFLTEPPANVTRNRTTRIATDVELPANETRTLGIPGPTDQTVADVLGSGFDGTVELYDPGTDTWKTVEVGSGVELEPLDVLRVTPENDTVAVLTFRTAPGGSATDGSERGGDDSGDGPGDQPPANSEGRVLLDRGTNVVAAATYSPVEEAFVTPSGSVTEVSSLAPGPDSQLGPRGALNGTHETDGEGAGPAVSPFAGYAVHSERPTPIEVSLEETPTVYELYVQLGLDRPSLTGLNTNLTAASSYPFEVVSAVEGAGASERLAIAERVGAAGGTTNATHDRLLEAGIAAANETSTETTDLAVIERAVAEAVREEAARLGVELTPRQVGRIVDEALDACHRQPDCGATAQGP